MIGFYPNREERKNKEYATEKFLQLDIAQSLQYQISLSAVQVYISCVKSLHMHILNGFTLNSQNGQLPIDHIRILSIGLELACNGG